MGSMGDPLVLPQGTVVHVAGLPFMLAQPTSVWGRQENLDLALSEIRKPQTSSGATEAR